MNGLIIAAMLMMTTTAATDKDWDRVIHTVPLIPATPATYNHLQYLKMMAHHGRGEKTQATMSAEALLDSFQPIERRHEIVAEIVLRDMETWTDGDLGDVDRLMVRAADRLRNGRIPSTIPIQDEILRKLDRMIAEQERPPSSSDSSQPVDPKETGNQFPPVTGKGLVSPKVLRQLEQTWGTMPEKERERIKTEMQRSIPDKYRPMVEEYLKTLGKHTSGE